MWWPLRLLSLFCAAPLGAVSQFPFDLIDLGPPANGNSASFTLNEKDEVIGVFHSPTVPFAEANQPFIWNGTFNPLPNFGENSWPNDINIHSHIVGQAFTNGAWRAWLFKDSQYHLLPGVAAIALNDHGDIAGQIDGAAYLISSTPPVRLTGSIPGSSNFCFGIVADLNNSRSFVARVCEYSILGSSLQFPGARRLDPVWPIPVGHSTYARAMNEKGQIAGQVKMLYYVEQAALWSNGDWHELGAPLQNVSYPMDINDSGLIVGGEGVFGRALLWVTNRVGYDLNTLVALPEGSELYLASGINNRNSIAATLRANHKTKAVLLRRNSHPLNLPTYEISRPAHPVAHISNAVVSVSLLDSEDHPGRKITKVIYTLFWRTETPAESYGDFFKHTTYSSWTDRIDEVTSEPFSISYTNLQARPYVVTAEVHDSTGLRAYCVPKRFLVTTTSQLLSPRKMSDGMFQFSFIGPLDPSPRVQTSTNLHDWIPLRSLQPQTAIIHDSTTDAHRFYRAVPPD